MNFTQLIDHLPFRINFLRIAGFPSIVDISYEHSAVKISETAGPPLIHRAGKATWQPLWSESVEIPWESSPDEAGGKIKDLLTAWGSKGKRTLLHLRSQAVRCVSADLPEGETRVREWIEDHADALLGIPVSPRDLAFDFKTLSAIDGGTRIKIAFARREEIKKCIDICQASGLSPVSVAWKPTDEVGSGNDFDFLPEELKDANETTVYRTLAKRAAFASGSVLLVLLLFEAAASFYVDSLSSELDESSRSARAANEEVRRLETDVTKLEARLDVVRVGSERTQLARTLHDIARTLPQGIRLTQLDVRESSGGSIAFQTEGEVLSHERLASYLAALDTADFCKNVGLASSGGPKSTWGNERKSTTGKVGFELRGEAR